MNLNKCGLKLKRMNTTSKKMRQILLIIISLFMSFGAVTAATEITDTFISVGGSNVCLADGSVFQERINGVYYIETDDATDIQTKINLAASNNGGEVRLIGHGNVYNLNKQINLSDNVYLIGEGYPIINVTSNITAFEFYEVTNSGIKGIEIKGNGFGSWNNITAVTLYNSTNIRVENMRIHDYTSQAIMCWYQVGYGKSGDYEDFGCKDSWILNNEIYNIEHTGIELHGSDSEGNTIQGNKLFNIDRRAIKIYAGADNNQIINNYCSNITVEPDAACITVRAANKNLVDGNIIKNVNLGVLLAQGAQINKVSNNIISNASLVAIRSFYTVSYPDDYVKNNLYLNNYIYNSTIGFETYEHGASFGGNYIFNTTDKAIYARAYSNNSKYYDNFIYGGNIGFDIDSYSNILENNNVQENSGTDYALYVGQASLLNNYPDSGKGSLFDEDGLMTEEITATSFISLKGLFGLPRNTQTISAGEITVSRSAHNVDTEGATATDNLDTINGGTDGDILIIRTVTASRDVTVTESGNIKLVNTTRVLDNSNDILMLMKISTFWVEVSFSDND